ncbi:MAG: hypothetical protein ACI9OJ_001291 [Myxococcota bacterium]|jgi:hypothetical protein
MVWSTDGAGIRAAMDSAREPIRECYEGWVRSNPELGGKLVVRFVIEVPEEPKDDTSGRVTSVEIPDSEIEHPLLEGCVLNAVTALRFSNPDEPITVSYPFSFVAKNESGTDDESQ